MAIRVTEGRYADLTFDVDGTEQFTLTLDQATWVREWLQRHLPAATRSRGQRVRSIWRHVKASQYKKRLTLLSDLEGDRIIVAVEMPGRHEYPSIEEFIGYVPVADRPIAEQYFRDLGGDLSEKKGEFDDAEKTNTT